MFDFLISVWREICELAVAHPVAQTIGAFGMVVGCMAYQARTPNRMLLIQALACLAWGWHFLLLGAFSGVALNFAGALRNVIYTRRSSMHWLNTLWCPILFSLVFSCAALFSGIFGGEGWRCLISMSAQVLGSFVFYSARIGFIRWGAIVVSLLWLIYDALAGSIPGVICEIINQFSLYIAIYRYRERHHYNVA